MDKPRTRWMLLFPALVLATFWFLLRGQDLGQLRAVLWQADPCWLCAGVAAMAVYFALEGRNLRTALSVFDVDAPYRDCLSYALTGFFFSSVTPSASGGQPMQLLAMHRRGIDPAPGALALLTEFFSFQIVAVLYGSVGLLLARGQLGQLPGGLWLFFLFGALLDLTVLLALALAVSSPGLAPSLWRRLRPLVRRIAPRRCERLETWGRAQWHDLRRCVSCCRGHRGRLVSLLVTDVLRFTAYHSVPFWVALALGADGAALIPMLAVQAVLFVSVASLPLPGAVGASEGGFLLLYTAFFPQELLSGAMLLSRGVSFYLFLLIGALAAGVAFFSSPAAHLSLQRPLGER